MKLRLFLLVAILIILPSLSLASRGISLDLTRPDGSTENFSLYKESHALLVGVSDYTNGWPDLESIPIELKKIEDVLLSKGFTVETIMNPDSDGLVKAFDNFIDRYGFAPENRLLFFFSGHGYSRMNGKKGYIVPVDAPDPTVDERGFLRKSVEMEMLLTWAKRIESKHALFLFDSCFSGTIFKSRALPKEPPHITAMVARPVRQFISAGSAGEEVPANSVFVPSFLRALEGEGDLDKDGYVTGTELGMYLNRKVSGYQVGQTPQYGKIRNPDLDQGDFVLLSGFKDSTPSSREPGTLEVKSNPYGATIYVDGKPKGTAPLILDGLSNGKLQVRAEKKGYLGKEEYVLIRSGRKSELDLNLDAIVSAGSIEINSTPSGARWYLNGAYVGTTPDHMRDLAPGSYSIEIKSDGFTDYIESVLVHSGEVVLVTPKLQKKISKPTENSNVLHANKKDSDSKQEKNAESLFNAGVALLKNQKASEAYEMFLSAIKYDEDDPKIYDAIAQAFTLRLDFVAAEENFKKAISLSNGNPRYYNNLAALYLKTNQYDEAIDAFQVAAKNISFEQPEIAWVGTGYAYFKKTNYLESIDAYKKAIELNPRYALALYRLGESYYQLDRLDEALVMFNRSLKLVPNSAVIYYKKGILYVKKREPDNAKESFKKVISLDPKSEYAQQSKEYIKLLN